MYRRFFCVTSLWIPPYFNRLWSALETIFITEHNNIGNISATGRIEVWKQSVSTWYGNRWHRYVLSVMYSVIRCCGNRLFNYGNIAKVCFVFLVVSTICVIEGRARRRYPNDRNVFIYLQFFLSTSFTDVCLTLSLRWMAFVVLESFRF